MKKNDPQAKTDTAAKTEGLAVGEPPKATHWVMCVLYVLFPCCMAFVMLTPVDVLQRYPQVVPYVDWMASWHPYVHRIGLTEISGRLADVNRFCAAVMWGLWTPLLVPLFVVMFIRDGSVKPFTSIRGVLFALIGMPLTAFACLHATGDMDSRIGQFLAINPLGRAIFIPGIAGCFWLFVYATFAVWRSAFHRNFDF